MNRGSEASQAADRGVFDASMRPRFMNRGSPPRLRRLATPPARFNEAPIHESGKFDRYGPVSRFVSRFNEAPIHESGKWPMLGLDIRYPHQLQ